MWYPEANEYSLPCAQSFYRGGAGMRWLKSDTWRIGIPLAGLLLVLIFMVWVPMSASAHGGTSVLTGPRTIQATPTEDATLTALNKEKLQQDIAMDRNAIAKDQSDRFWAWTGSGTIIVGIAGVIFSLFQFYRAQLDKRVEQERKDEEEFHTLIRDLGSDKIVVKIDASITLR